MAGRSKPFSEHWYDLGKRRGRMTERPVGADNYEWELNRAWELEEEYVRFRLDADRKLAYRQFELGFTRSARAQGGWTK